jgi:hypothetical protein
VALLPVPHLPEQQSALFALLVQAAPSVSAGF